jgi:hypothetical protein
MTDPNAYDPKVMRVGEELVKLCAERQLNHRQAAAILLLSANFLLSMKDGGATCEHLAAVPAILSRTGPMSRDEAMALISFFGHRLMMASQQERPWWENN